MTKRILSFLMALMLLCGIASIAAAEEPATLTIATTRRTTTAGSGTRVGVRLDNTGVTFGGQPLVIAKQFRR